ncbi:MAG: hypothetical protein WBE11_19790 [Candidatus Aminicenantaceae bacterium]
MIEELNKGNTNFFNEFYAPDYVYCFPSNNPKPIEEADMLGLMQQLGMELKPKEGK